MKRVFLIVALATSLGGCASFQADMQKFDQGVATVFHVLTSASVTPQQIIVAANSFDALEATATQYLDYCANAAAQAACSLSNRKVVVKAVRAGRAARNQLEPYVVSNTAGPKAVFDTLIAAISALQSSPAATGGQ